MVSPDSRGLPEAKEPVPDAYEDLSSSAEPKTSLQSQSPPRESDESGDTTSPATSPSLLHREPKRGAESSPASTAFVRHLHARLVEVQLEQESHLSYNRNLSLHRRSRSLHASHKFEDTSGSGVDIPFDGLSGCQVEPSRDTRLKRKLSAAEGLLAPLGNEVSSPSKKRLRRNGTVPSTKLILRTASLRRAASLRAVAQCGSGPVAEELVPTVPVTPDEFSTSARRESSLSSIPIIAPSRTASLRLPLNVETMAKIRLGKYKEREGRTSENDCARCVQFVSDNENGGAEAVCESAQPNAIAWGTREDWESLLGLGRQIREERIDWLLQHLPAVSESGSTTSSFSSTSSGVSLGSCGHLCSKGSKLNLINQLTTSPETRFHAAWMFLRYFYLVGMSKKLGVRIDFGKLPAHSETVAWDVTLASLAISVKFHRDFLSPLLPVFAADYMDVAPHHMGYRAFEFAQRRMLSTFSYELGVTPQPFLDQVWAALPSLRKLLGFDGGWNQVKKETWRILLNSLYGSLFSSALVYYANFLTAPDAMRFLVSVLTTAALARAIVSVLAQRHYYESDWNSCFNFTCTVQDGLRVSNVALRFGTVAREDAEEVIIDVQAVIGVSDAEFEECQCWLGSNVLLG